MKVLDAVYVNTGGALRLLEYLIKKAGYIDNLMVVLDQRAPIFSSNRNYLYISPNETSRACFYRKNADAISAALCFGNVPPPIRLRAHVKTYFHQRLFLDPPPLFVPTIIPSLRYRAKAAYIRHRVRNTDEFVVQTCSMRSLLLRSFKIEASRVEIVPFYDEGRFAGCGVSEKSSNDFAFVSLPLAHKGHADLFNAWKILSQRGLFPELHLTIEERHPLAQEVLSLRKQGLNIRNHGFCDPTEIYSKCKYQIYPSHAESFGLGLIESVEAGCDVLAPDLPYVYDVVRPSLSWKHGSAYDIAEKVELAMKGDCPPSFLAVSNKVTEILNFLAHGA